MNTNNYKTETITIQEESFNDLTIGTYLDVSSCQLEVTKRIGEFARTDLLPINQFFTANGRIKYDKVENKARQKGIPVNVIAKSLYQAHELGLPLIHLSRIKEPGVNPVVASVSPQLLNDRSKCPICSNSTIRLPKILHNTGRLTDYENFNGMAIVSRSTRMPDAYRKVLWHKEHYDNVYECKVPNYRYDGRLYDGFYHSRQLFGHPHHHLFRRGSKVFVQDISEVFGLHGEFSAIVWVNLVSLLKAVRTVASRKTLIYTVSDGPMVNLQSPSDLMIPTYPSFGKFVDTLDDQRKAYICAFLSYTLSIMSKNDNLLLPPDGLFSVDGTVDYQSFTEWTISEGIFNDDVKSLCERHDELGRYYLINQHEFVRSASATPYIGITFHYNLVITLTKPGLLDNIHDKLFTDDTYVLLRHYTGGNGHNRPSFPHMQLDISGYRNYLGIPEEVEVTLRAHFFYGEDNMENLSSVLVKRQYVIWLNVESTWDYNCVTHNVNFHKYGTIKKELYYLSIGHWNELKQRFINTRKLLWPKKSTEEEVEETF